jgi:signal transduction histidine kinase
VSGAVALAGGALLTALAAAVIGRCWLAGHSRALARACHELRGPLTAARLGLELGSRIGQLPAPRLRAIDGELERAALALEDLCELWRRGRPGRRRPRGAGREPVELGRLLGDCVEAWRPAATVRGAELRLVAEGEARVLAERLRLAQAAGNLIANAIEHGGGTVEVRLRSERGRVRVEVVDGGAGLPAPLAELTRRRAGRLAWLRAPDPHGHGLAITAAVARSHGGRLECAPGPGGARLVLDLPAVSASASRRPSA